MLRAKHVRHRTHDRLRHSWRFLAFLAEQGTRLGETASAIFARMKAGASAAAIRALPTPEE